VNGTVLEQLSRKLVVWDYLSFCYPKLIDLWWVTRKMLAAPPSWNSDIHGSCGRVK
jgi:hypothetical protein